MSTVAFPYCFFTKTGRIKFIPKAKQMYSMYKKHISFGFCLNFSPKNRRRGGGGGGGLAFG